MPESIETEITKATRKLLSEVPLIKAKHYYIRKASKQNFNFFQGLTRSKTHLEEYHSNFIAYLLDPKGTHDCDSFFLNRFIKKIRESKTIVNDIKDEELLTAEVGREIVIDPAGRIDILLQSKSKNSWVIFIENKVRSEESENQVKSYHDYYKNTKNYEKVIGI